MHTWTLDGLADAYARVSSHNGRALDHLTTVAAQFHRTGIDFVLLKGADLLSRLYGVRGLRPMVDVDLLVHEADLPAVDETLTRLGCLPQIDGNPAYVSPDRHLTLDITSSIWYLRTERDLEGVWQRAIRRTIAGEAVKAMGSEDLLLYLAAYAVLHRGQLTPRLATDLALLLRREHLSWDFVLEEAARHHLRVPLHHALSYTRSHGQLHGIPASCVGRLAPSGLRERALSLLLGKLVTERYTDGLSFFLLFITQPGRRKWQWLSRSLFPSDAFLTYRYGAAGRTHPFRLRVSRVAYLLGRAQRLLLRILRLLLTRTERGSS